jgi:hypothetical protein
MNKDHLIIAIVLLVVTNTVCGLYFYDSGFSNGARWYKNLPSLKDDFPGKGEQYTGGGIDPIFREDYPLLEYRFDQNEKKDEWLLVIQYGISDRARYAVIKADELLEWNKEFFRLQIFVAGRGITPDGQICLYHNKELVKDLLFSQIDLGTTALKKAAKSVTLEDIRKLTGGDLPSVI